MKLLPPIFSLLLFVAPATLYAAEFVVTTPIDAVDANPGDGLCSSVAEECSLRAAIQEANALAGEDLITLPANIYKLSLAGDAEDLSATGDLDIRSTLTIQGAGADQVFIDGMDLDRVFHIVFDRNAGLLADATINGVTIRNGNANAPTGSNAMGGGIRSDAILKLNDCNIDNNYSMAGGGGIFASRFGYPAWGYLEINRCNITNNFDSGFGGGVSSNDVQLKIHDSFIGGNEASNISGSIFGGGLYYADSSVLMPLDSEVVNTTIAGNSAMTQGGGIYVHYGQLSITNSTISGNHAPDNGGGLFISGDGNVSLTNLTITNNTSNAGGGLYLESPTATATITDSIIAANPLGDNCRNTGGTLNMLGSNIDSDASCGASLSGVDARLEMLGDNGGPGQTHALLSGSPAINSASNCLATDQRSYARPSSGCDVGAYEVEGIAPTQEVVTPELNSGTSTDANNNAPTAFNLPYAVIAGGVVDGVMNAFDPNGDPLFFEFPLSGPSQGSVGSPEQGGIPESFVYTPLATATGVDSFSYRACDNRGACSAPATIRISISSAVVANEINVEINTTGGNSNDLVVVSEANLNAIAPDTDYDYPIGGYFFQVKDVPTDNNGNAGQAVVLIQLPAAADLSNATVRKMDNSGTWRTLGSTPDPSVSTATMDTVANSITLTLRDNDIFDTNLTLGIINDPIAVGILKSQAEPEPTPSSNTTVSNDSGGGVISLWLLLLLACHHRKHFFFCWR